MENWKHLKGKAADAFDDVPTGYFETLKKDVMQQLEHPQAKPVVKQRWVYARVAAVLFFILASAALMLLVFTPERTMKLSENRGSQNGIQAIVDDSGKLTEKALQFTQPAISDTLGWDDIPTDELIEYLLQWEIDEF